MTKNVKQRERDHLLLTVDAYGPLPAWRIREIANGECQHDSYDDLPEIGPKGITPKLNSMSLDGLLEADLTPDETGHIWWRTTKPGSEKAKLLLASLEEADAEYLARAAKETS